MQSKAVTPNQYVAELPDERRQAIENLRIVVKNNLPAGFEEVMSYGMLGYVVPHSIYPNGYHCNPKDPLPFFAVASQKNSINIYHMAMYMDKNLYDWFVTEYAKHSSKKLDIGKSCVRFKKTEDIPIELIGALVSKITTNDWIAMYEKVLKK